MFANNCLKRKLEVTRRNGFSATEDLDMRFQDHDCSFKSEVGLSDFENFNLKDYRNVVYKLFVGGWHGLTFNFQRRSHDQLISDFLSLCFDV